MSRPLSVLDLFSGIGGFALGLEAAGMETVAFCEVSPVCRHLLAHHWPKVPQYDDVCTLTADRLAADGIAVDVICGGFPCQDLSFAGAGAGLDGARSGLFFEIVRLAREIKQHSGRLPLLVLENVSALLSRGIGDVLGALAALGYDAWWDCIPASAVGAPHRRDRVWIVAYARGQQHQGYGDALRRAIASELSRAAAEQSVRAWDDDQAVSQHPDTNGFGSYRAEIDFDGDSKLRDEQVGELGPLGEDVADAGSEGLSRLQLIRTDSGEAGRRREGPSLPAPERCDDGGRRLGGWSTEPNVGRVAHGVPARVDRLHGLGNAVIPQIPEIIGRAILTALASESLAA